MILRSLANLALGLLSGAAALVAIEAALRWSAWQSEQRAIAAMTSAERPPFEPGAKVEMRDIIIPSQHPEVVFQLPNNLDVQFCRNRLSTNSQGFRSPEVSGSKPQGTARIVGIGDSVMFGWGVNDGEDYMAQLGAMLGSGTTGRRWEVVNTAVPGYNTWMEVATLEHRALPLEPDIVVYGYCINDGELPRFLRRTDDYLTLRSSYLLAFLGSRRRAGRAAGEDDMRVLVESPIFRGRRSESTDPSKVPPEYAHMVGAEAQDRALDRLQELSRDHGFRVVVLVHPPAAPDLDSDLQRPGFSVVHTQPAIDRHLAGRQDADAARQELYVGRPCTGKGIDMHPSPLAHRLIAQSLLEHIERMEPLAAGSGHVTLEGVKERSGAGPAERGTPRGRS